ncbi:MAG: hypothetical protein ABSA40_03235 [Candidatus Dormibacteria bacterium]
MILVLGLLELAGAVVVLVLIVGSALFRWERYRGGPRGVDGVVPPPGGQPTTERFIDPETGRVMRVWFDSRTGERTYREE